MSIGLAFPLLLSLQVDVPKFKPANGTTLSYRSAVYVTGGVPKTILERLIYKFARVKGGTYRLLITSSDNSIDGEPTKGSEFSINYTPLPRRPDGFLATLDLLTYSIFQERRVHNRTAWASRLTSKGTNYEFTFEYRGKYVIVPENYWHVGQPTIQYVDSSQKNADYSYQMAILTGKQAEEVNFEAKQRGPVEESLSGSMWVDSNDGHLVSLHAYVTVPRANNGATVSLEHTLIQEQEGWLGGSDIDLSGSPYDAIHSNLKSVSLHGIAGKIQFRSQEWRTIVSGTAVPAESFASVRDYGGGRVCIIGHEGLFRDLDRADNRKFLARLGCWLTKKRTPRVAFTSEHREWISPDIYALPRSMLSELGAKQVDLLVIGTAWSDFTGAELSFIDEFVRNGGGLLLTGIGWSWTHQVPGRDIDDYPMNKIAAMFGAQFIDGTVKGREAANGFTDFAFADGK